MGPLRVDEPENVHRIPSSLAKKAVAFRKTSFFLLEDAILPPEPAQLFPLFGGEPFAFSGVELVVADPPPQRHCGYPYLLGRLRDRPARRAVELDGLLLELRRIVRCWSRHRGAPFGGLIVPTLECPPYRGKPSRTRRCRARRGRLLTGGEGSGRGFLAESPILGKFSETGLPVYGVLRRADLLFWAYKRGM
jgi:hypothetical protein